MYSLMFQGLDQVFGDVFWCCRDVQPAELNQLTATGIRCRDEGDYRDKIRLMVLKRILQLL